MKNPLERSAVLSKDTSEQPPGKYVVMIPDMNIVLTADRIELSANSLATAIRVISEEKVVASFAATVPWLMVEQSRIEVITREAQLRRQYANREAEEKLVQELTGDVTGTVAGQSLDMPKATDRFPGNYL